VMRRFPVWLVQVTFPRQPSATQRFCVAAQSDKVATALVRHKIPIDAHAEVLGKLSEESATGLIELIDLQDGDVIPWPSGGLSYQVV